MALPDEREEPEAVLRRRESIRRLVDDLADLPVRQRTALLARELDDQTPEQVAAQLGVSVPAAQMLATRARENLLKTRAARDADHADIRAALLDAHERGVRPTEHVLRHVDDCADCARLPAGSAQADEAAARAEPRVRPAVAGRRRKAARAPGAGKAAVGAAAAIAVAATGGVIVLATDTRGSGEAAPFVLKGIKPLTGRAVNTGDTVPRGTALVTARVRVPAGAPQDGERRSVTLACPDAMKVAGLQAPEQRFPLTYGLSKGTVIGNSTRARIDFGRAILPRDYDVTVGVLCRRADAAGSITDNPRRTRTGEQKGRVCDRSAYLYREPGKTFLGTVFKGQPVSILRRSASGEWARVISDTRNTGWMKVSALCG